MIVLIPSGTKKISVLLNVQSSSGAHQTSYWIRSRRCSPGVKPPDHEAGQSSLYNADLKNLWSYTSAPPACLPGMKRINFTLSIIVLMQSVMRVNYIIRLLIISVDS